VSVDVQPQDHMAESARHGLIPLAWQNVSCRLPSQDRPCDFPKLATKPVLIWHQTSCLNVLWEGRTPCAPQNMHSSNACTTPLKPAARAFDCTQMEKVPIACLCPDLPSFHTKVMTGLVVLVWPYSHLECKSSLLLAEPDARIRRNGGHVRVRLSGASAQHAFKCGVTIGDEITIELRSARFTENSNSNLVTTAGERVKWDLAFESRLFATFSRNGDNYVLHVDHAACSEDAGGTH